MDISITHELVEKGLANLKVSSSEEIILQLNESLERVFYECQISNIEEILKKGGVNAIKNG